MLVLLGAGWAWLFQGFGLTSGLTLLALLLAPIAILGLSLRRRGAERDRRS